MTSRYAIPSLSKTGWIKQTISVFDQMIGEFFLAEYSQTFFFGGAVSSFPWILQQYRDDLQRIVTVTQETLQRYLATQFNDVTVVVDYKPQEDSINLYTLTLYIDVVDMEGQKINFNRLIRFNDTKVNEIMKELTN